MSGKFILSLAFVAILKSVTAQDHVPFTPSPETCDVPRLDQKICGYGSEEKCVKSGCCWDGANDIKCFHPAKPCDFPWNCFHGSTCVESGPVGEGIFKCECPPHSNRKNCRTRQGQCVIEESRKTACGIVNDFPKAGFQGSPREACEARGCCYNNSVPDTKWCFHPKFKMPG